MRAIALCVFASAVMLHAQDAPPQPPPVPVTQTPATPTPETLPLAVVPVDGVQISGAMQVADGKATIGASGSVTAGDRTVTVALPGRGQIRLCATTHVGLSADKSIAASLEANEAPGLMMALDRGAIEANFDTGKNSDVILTPDFRITISGPGRSAVAVRLGEKGDTCVDNRGPNAPYVMVSGVFEGGVYRVQPEQRVLFEHGSLHEVVDREKELCGCPDEMPPAVLAKATPNPFPVAQSAGLAPIKTPPPPASQPGVDQAQATATLKYNGDEPKQPDATVTVAAPVAAAAPQPAKQDEKPKGLFGRMGRFFRKLFGG